LKSLVKVKSESFSGSIWVPTSKSWANRLLCLASITEREIVIRNIPQSTDVQSMINCLVKIGLKIEVRENVIKVKNSFPACEVEKDKEIVLESGDGGTTNRFLLPMLSLGKNAYVLAPEVEMSNRPMNELFRVVESLGAISYLNNKKQFVVKGPVNVNKKDVEVDCSQTTQFLTGLMISYLNCPFSIKGINLKSSAKYLELTDHLIELFAKGKSDFTIPVDFSSASYPIALGATMDGCCIENCLGIDSYQADSIFLKILEDINGRFEFKNNQLIINASDELKSFSLDCQGFPDLVPTLCYLACCVKGESVLSGLEVLKFKESNRIEGILNILKQYDVNFSFCSEKNQLKIQGETAVNKWIKYMPAEDHRMVMMSYLFMRKFGGGVLGNAHCVNKSFPKFFESLVDPGSRSN